MKVAFSDLMKWKKKTHNVYTLELSTVTPLMARILNQFSESCKFKFFVFCEIFLKLR